MNTRLHPPMAADSRLLAPEVIRAARELIIHHRDTERIRHQTALAHLEKQEAELQGRCTHHNKTAIEGFAEFDGMQVCDDCGKAW